MFDGVSWVALANFVPLLFGVVILPRLIASMGIELFGLLTIIWMLIGYLSLFDLGLGRSLTYAISRTLGAPSEKQGLTALYSTGMSLIIVLALVASILMFALSGFVASLVIHADAGIRADAVAGLHWAAVAVFFTVIASGQRGVMEGYGKFRESSLGRVVIGTWMVLGPYFFFLLTRDFALAVVAILLARAFLVAYYHYCIRKIVKYSAGYTNKAAALKLLNFGGWMTVSNVISPLMVYFDRVFIAAWLGLSAVSYYTTPFEVISRLLLIPATVGTVIFPRMTMHHQSARASAFHKLSFYSYVVNFILLAPIPIILFFFGQGIMGFWINPDFARHSAPIALILSLGCLMNSMASVPFNRLQAMDGARTTALIHAGEAILYLSVMVIGMRNHMLDLIGVAWVWTGRVTLDWILMEIFSKWNVARG